MKHTGIINQLRSRLIEVMTDKKITQTQLADILGCDQSTISKFLSNNRGLSGELAIKLQSFIHVNFSQQNNLTAMNN